MRTNLLIVFLALACNSTDSPAPARRRLSSLTTSSLAHDLAALRRFVADKRIDLNDQQFVTFLFLCKIDRSPRVQQLRKPTPLPLPTGMPEYLRPNWNRLSSTEQFEVLERSQFKQEVLELVATKELSAGALNMAYLEFEIGYGCSGGAEIIGQFDP